MKVFIDGDGCILRKLDSNTLHNYFSINGVEILDSPEKADHVVYVTCGVNELMVQLCLSKIKKYDLPESRLIIVGCMPDITPDLINATCVGHKTIPTRNLHEIDQLFPDFNVKFNDVPVSSTFSAHGNQHVRHRFNFGWSDIINYSKGKRFLTKLQFYAFHKRISQKQFAFLVTSRGCDHHCTYCGIRTAVGSLKSVPSEKVLKQYEKMMSEGYRHVFFFSDDTAAYGKDIGERFSDLLTMLDKSSPNDATWGFVNVHPASLIQNFDTINALVKSKRIVFIECAMQHFSPSVLKRMARIYNTEEVLEKLSILKRSYSKLCITTHFIIGFPGETEEDMEIASRHLQHANIDYYDLLLYYESGTSPSTKLGDKVEPEIAFSRIKRVSSLLNKQSVLRSIFPTHIIDQDVDDTHILVKK
jgi:MiaB/RimO family radical SAM methylthiotransferase